MVSVANEKLNARCESLKAQTAELEQKTEASHKAAISLPKIQHFVKLIREKL